MTASVTTGQNDGDLVPEFFTVAKKSREYNGVVTLELEAHDNRKEWRTPQPGQFNMLYAFGAGEVPISFSGLPEARQRLVHTIRNAGAASAALTQLKCGDAVGVRGPFGVGWPLETLIDRNVIIIAGGLGLAPIKPVIEHLLTNRGGALPVALLYGARDPDTILFKPDLERWGAKSKINVRITVDTAGLDWRGHVGHVTSLLTGVEFQPRQTTAFICGPEIMMRHCAEALQDAGVSEADIWLSMERNMKCATGLCGHCQFGPAFICKDGPVFRYDHIRANLFVKEL